VPSRAYVKKGKGLPQQAEVVQGVLGRLRPRIFLTFETTRLVGISLTHRPALPQENSLVIIFRRRAYVVLQY
jgi:hypothetical protein